jgi:hypothetical protein
MSQIFEKVFEVFGEELPAGTSEYSAVQAAPVSVLQIRKEFKTYSNFSTQYKLFLVEKSREKTQENTVVTKPLASEVTKNVTK